MTDELKQADSIREGLEAMNKTIRSIQEDLEAVNKTIRRAQFWLGLASALCWAAFWLICVL